MKGARANTMLRIVWSVAALVLLAACGTPEYRAERNICASTWHAKIPPQLERELYIRTLTRRVPTGRTTCKGSGDNIICHHVMRTEFYTVPAIRIIDTNKPRRDAQINLCTQKSCLKKFGNAECKV